MKKKICLIIIAWIMFFPLSAFVTELLTEWGIIYKGEDGFYKSGSSLDGIGNFYEFSKMIIGFPFIAFSDKPITALLVCAVYYPLIMSILYYAFKGITGDNKDIRR